MESQDSPASLPIMLPLGLSDSSCVCFILVFKKVKLDLQTLAVIALKTNYKEPGGPVERMLSKSYKGQRD